MAIITKRFLSASSGGRGVSVTGTTATGSVIHTSVTGTTSFDEVWVWAVNTATAAKKLTVEWARSTGQVGQAVEFSVPPEDGPYLIIPGWPLNTGRSVRAFAATASVITCHGYVHRLV